MSKAEKTRHRLLKAARDVALEAGASHLTLEAVARCAGVSKGGVLYHFSSKSDLFQSLMAFLLDDFEEQVERIHQEEGCNWLTAYLRASFPQDKAGHVRETNILFEILTLEPELRPALQERFRSWQNRAHSEKLPPAEAHLYRAAIDGLWYNEMFGFHVPVDELAVVVKLLGQRIG